MEDVLNYLKGIIWVLFLFITIQVRADFVQINPLSPGQFLDQHGKPLAVHGINRFAIYEAKDNQDDMDVEAYFKYLADNHFNLVRVIVREGYVKEGQREVKIPLESILGVYNQEHLQELDSVMEMAKKYKVYVILCIFDHYFLSHAWVPDIASSRIPIERATPYYLPQTISDEFYSDPNLRFYAKKRASFLASRYKNEKYLFAWEPMNEVNGVLKDSYTPENQQVFNWYEDVASAIKNADPHHLVSLSLTGDLYYSPEGEYQPWVSFYKSSATDIIQIHSYGFDNANWRTFLKGPFNNSLKIAKSFHKPVLLGEFSVRTDNPIRNEIIKEIYQTAKDNQIPAMLWTHRWDQFGDLNKKIIKIYHQIFLKKDTL